jgi:hypothetical protein
LPWSVNYHRNFRFTAKNRPISYRFWILFSGIRLGRNPRQVKTSSVFLGRHSPVIREQPDSDRFSKNRIRRQPSLNSCSLA